MIFRENSCFCSNSVVTVVHKLYYSNHVLLFFKRFFLGLSWFYFSNHFCCLVKWLFFRFILFERFTINNNTQPALHRWFNVKDQRWINVQLRFVSDRDVVSPSYFQRGWIAVRNRCRINAELVVFAKRNNVKFAPVSMSFKH